MCHCEQTSTTHSMLYFLLQLGDLAKPWVISLFVHHSGRSLFWKWIILQLLEMHYCRVIVPCTYPDYVNFNQYISVKLPFLLKNLESCEIFLKFFLNRNTMYLFLTVHVFVEYFRSLILQIDNILMEIKGIYWVVENRRYTKCMCVLKWNVLLLCSINLWNFVHRLYTIERSLLTSI